MDLLHCTIEPGNGERTLCRAAGLDRHPARDPRHAAFAQVFGRFFDIRLGPGRRTLAKTGAKKTEPAVTRSERPAIIVARNANNVGVNSRALAERRRPLRCVIGLRPPAGASHLAFDRPP
jgi:hypothetical protein